MGIVTGIARVVLGPVFDLVENLFTKYVNKQITIEEVRRDIEIARTRAEASLEREVTQRFEAFQETLRSSPMLQRLLSAVVISQLCILLFYQFGVPAILFAFGWVWPVPELQLEWAYLLVAGSLGLKAVAR